MTRFYQLASFSAIVFSCSFTLTGSVSNVKSSVGFFEQARNNIASLNDRVLMENAENLGRMEKELIGQKLGKIEKLIKIPLKAVSSKPAGVKNLLLRDGVICISNVLSPSQCDIMFPLVKEIEDGAVLDAESGVAGM